MITQQQQDAYEKALAGFLQAGYSQRVAEFYAKVSAGIVSGDIIEGDMRRALGTDDPPASNANGGAL